MEATLLVEQQFGVGPRPDSQIAVGCVLERCDPQPRQATLRHAEDVAFTTKLEVALRELEAVA
jgi:hypothetical protein